METASLKEIKKELKTIPPQQLHEIVLRLAKFKKENKELLSYCLFDAFNKPAYIKAIKDEIDGHLKNTHKNNPHLTTKVIRKILKNINKYIRFIGSKEIEVELLVYLCRQIKKYSRQLNYNRALDTLYGNLIKRIKKTLATLHEDLQMDYEETLKNI
ncbi:MAG: hypothetical protein LBV47_00690 [Bacteroidales bacterium]|jgi:gamma-glutamyl:cysteine ligase YbdK (ATP-grasp superfamily)|nr:hypothetical protein [Bacteroidales bacterium]